MILLAINVAVLDEHASLTCLETNASLSSHAAAIGAAVDRRIVQSLVHDGRHDDDEMDLRRNTRPSRNNETNDA